MTDTATNPIPAGQPVNPIITRFLETGELTDEMSALMETDPAAYKAVYDATVRDLAPLQAIGRLMIQRRAERQAAATAEKKK